MKQITNLVQLLNAFIIIGTVGAYEQDAVTFTSLMLRISALILISFAVKKVSALVTANNKHRKSKLQFPNRSLHNYSIENQ